MELVLDTEHNDNLEKERIRETKTIFAECYCNYCTQRIFYSNFWSIKNFINLHEQNHNQKGCVDVIEIDRFNRAKITRNDLKPWWM